MRVYKVQSPRNLDPVPHRVVHRVSRGGKKVSYSIGDLLDQTQLGQVNPK